MHCGVACLVMALSQMGRRVDVGRVEEFCTPTNQGVSLKGIADAAGCLGLKGTAVRIPPDYLSSHEGPVILHWNQNHFVMFRRSSRGGRRFLIADPAKGERWYSLAELRHHWLVDPENPEGKGIALLLEKGGNFDAQAEEERCVRALSAESGSLRYLAGHLKSFKPHLSVVVFGLAVGCVLQLILPFLTQAIVDRGIAERSVPFMWLILIGELLIVLGRTSMDFIRRRLLLHISMRVNVRLVSEFFIKLMKLPMAFFDTKLMGDLLQRMNDHQRVQTFLTGQCLTVAFTLLSFIVFGVVLIIYSPVIFGVFAIGSVLYSAWIVSFMKRRKVLDYDMFEQQSINHNRTYQLVTTMQEIKLQDCCERRRKEWYDVQSELFEVQMRSLRLQQTQEGGSIFINEVRNILITVLSATAVINGHLTLGGMLAIQFIVGQLSAPVEQLMNFVYAMQDVRISMERIGEIRERADEDAVSACELPVCASPELQEIVVDHLSFRYDRHNPRFTLEDVSMRIPAGKVTAVVGSSGSGKTTLVKLLLGFYQPERGSVSVQNHDLRNLNLQVWRRRCGVVMQEGVIFSDTIARNIAAADGEPDMARVEEAARVACLHDTVMSFPMRYETRVGRDGMGLSLEQRQRILIARAVYRNPDYIFLDEATNSLDTRNEKSIVDGLRDFYRGRTVLVVAHRLSTVCDADNIVVLDSGRIVEQGTHDYLIGKRGYYYDLVKNQLELGS